MLWGACDPICPISLFLLLHASRTSGFLWRKRGTTLSDLSVLGGGSCAALLHWDYSTCSAALPLFVSIRSSAQKDKPGVIIQCDSENKFLMLSRRPSHVFPARLWNQKVPREWWSMEAELYKWEPKRTGTCQIFLLLKREASHFKPL